jgi:5-formyltetrahydrofolate cyclo-ligase
MGTDKHRLEKSELRSTVRTVLKNLSVEKRKLDSKKLREKLKEQSFFQSATSVLFFAPLANEADLWPLLEESVATEKIVALPRFDPSSQSYIACRVRNLQSEIISGRFDIREPHKNCAEIPLVHLDLVLVPGVAFDLNGHRLGRGKGFYDRLLQKVRGLKVGIAFEEQMVRKIPAEAHDVKMDFVLTPARCVKTER